MAGDGHAYLDGFQTGTAHALDLVRDCLARDLDPAEACDTVERVCADWVQAERFGNDAERLGWLLTRGHPIDV